MWTVKEKKWGQGMLTPNFRPITSPVSLYGATPTCLVNQSTAVQAE